jgi:hemerythrin-like domain-containing protein
MEATEMLMNEHRVIESMLLALQTAAQRVEQGREVRPGFFLDGTDFIKSFADGCHHQKEEGVLFKEMVAAGMPKNAGPVGDMRLEHEQGRNFTRAMREAAAKWQAGDAGARSAVIAAALSNAALLRQHIQKEDDILYPMAHQVIPSEVQARLVSDFERVEHEETGPGMHETYLALAEKLQKEMGL